MITTLIEGQREVIHTVHVKVGAEWERCRNVYAKADGEWRCLWNSEVVYLRPRRQVTRVQDVCLSAA